LGHRQAHFSEVRGGVRCGCSRGGRSILGGGGGKGRDRGRRQPGRRGWLLGRRLPTGFGGQRALRLGRRVGTSRVGTEHQALRRRRRKQRQVSQGATVALRIMGTVERFLGGRSRRTRPWDRARADDPWSPGPRPRPSAFRRVSQPRASPHDLRGGRLAPDPTARGSIGLQLGTGFFAAVTSPSGSGGTDTWRSSESS
jgi:hypothetical protein